MRKKSIKSHADKIRKKSKNNKRRRVKVPSQLGNGKWHFWLLHICTALFFFIGYGDGNYFTGLLLGIFVYSLPLLISLRFGLNLSKNDLSRFYKYSFKK
jgi:hypothetical protein